MHYAHFLLLLCALILPFLFVSAFVCVTLCTFLLVCVCVYCVCLFVRLCMCLFVCLCVCGNLCICMSVYFLYASALFCVSVYVLLRVFVHYAYLCVSHLM